MPERVSAASPDHKYKEGRDDSLGAESVAPRGIKTVDSVGVLLAMIDDNLDKMGQDGNQ